MIKVIRATLPGLMYTKSYLFLYKKLSFLVIIGFKKYGYMFRINVPYYVRRSGLSKEQIKVLKSYEDHFRH